MIWGKITVREVDTDKGVLESVSRYYDIAGDVPLSLAALADIKEWPMSNPSDTLLGIRTFLDSVYILQIGSKNSGVLKRITPSKTYIYDMIAFPFLMAIGAWTQYSAFEVIDEYTVIVGPAMADLRNMYIFPYEESSDSMLNIPFKMLGFVPVQKSVRRVADTMWAVANDVRENVFKKRISVYRRVSFFECLSCKDKLRILEAAGKDDLAESIECEEEEIGNVHGINGKGEYANNSSLKSLSQFVGMFSSSKSTAPKKDPKKCVDTFLRLVRAMNSMKFGAGVSSLLRDAGGYCSQQMLIGLPSYIAASFAAKRIREDFNASFMRGEVDYDAMFDAIENDVARNVVSLLMGGASFEDNILLLKRDPGIMAALYVLFRRKKYEDKYKKNGEWELFNPFRDVDPGSINDAASMLATVMASYQSASADVPLKFRKFRMRKKRYYSDEATYYSFGPSGCVEKIDLPLLDANEFDVMCDVELLDDRLYIWAWKDDGANPLTSYLTTPINLESYRLMVYEYDLKSKKMRKLDETGIERDFHPLDHRKMSVALSSDERWFVFKHYYLKDYRSGGIDYVEVKRPVDPALTDLMRSTRSLVFNANINNVTWYPGQRINNSAAPGFDESMAGPRDLGTKLITPRYF